MERKPHWQRETRKTVLHSPWIEVYEDSYTLPDGGQIPHYFIWKSSDSALCVCKIHHQDEDKVVLTHQYRPGIEKHTLCHPGGRLEQSDSTPISGALRELLEETGYTPKKIIPLGTFGQIPAITPNRVHLFLVECESSPIPPHKDKSEEIDITLVPIAKLKKVISSGKMDCIACVAASYLALNALRK